MPIDPRLFVPSTTSELDLQGLLRQSNDTGDAAFSERLWNAAVQAYLSMSGERPALN